MTIGFRSILVISFEKKKIQFLLEVLTAILKDFFIFLANGHHFQKCYFLMEILKFLKEVSSVFEKCQYLVALFSFNKK